MAEADGLEVSPNSRPNHRELKGRKKEKKAQTSGGQEWVQDGSRKGGEGTLTQVNRTTSLQAWSYLFIMTSV